MVKSITHNVITKLIVFKKFDWAFRYILSYAGLNLAFEAIGKHFDYSNIVRIVLTVLVFNPYVWTFGSEARHKGQFT
jgi:hypothetical protein